VAEIRLQEGESLENALSRFKRKVQSEDIIKEVKRHSSTQSLNNLHFIRAVPQFPEPLGTR